MVHQRSFRAVAGVGIIGALVLVAGMSSETAARLSREALVELRGAVSLEDRLHAVDEALDRHDLSAALFTWRDACAAAMAQLGWEPLADVADRALQIDAQYGPSLRYRDEVRALYRFALARARAERSADGLRRIATGFSTLGQDELAEIVRRMAERER